MTVSIVVIAEKVLHCAKSKITAQKSSRCSPSLIALYIILIITDRIIEKYVMPCAIAIMAARSGPFQALIIDVITICVNVTMW